MPNGWGVHLAELPGHSVVGGIGTTSERGVEHRRECKRVKKRIR